MLVAFQRTGEERRLPAAAAHLVGLLRSWGPGPDHLTGLALTGITLGPRFVDALVFTRSGVVVIAAHSPGISPGSAERAGAGVAAAKGALAAHDGGRYVTGLVAVVPGGVQEAVAEERDRLAEPGEHDSAGLPLSEAVTVPEPREPVAESRAHTEEPGGLEPDSAWGEPDSGDLVPEQAWGEPADRHGPEERWGEPDGPRPDQARSEPDPLDRDPDSVWRRPDPGELGPDQVWSGPDPTGREPDSSLRRSDPGELGPDSGGPAPDQAWSGPGSTGRDSDSARRRPDPGGLGPGPTVREPNPARRDSAPEQTWGHPDLPWLDTDSFPGVAVVLADPRGLRRIIGQHNRWRTVWSADDVLDACYALSLAHLAPPRAALLADGFPARLPTMKPLPALPAVLPLPADPPPDAAVDEPGPRIPRPRGQSVFPKQRPIRLVPWALVFVLTLLVTVGVIAAVFVAQVFHGS
ncbi:hypothetical protein Amsp01_028110 [Amycolatopsis sp. NBRC 101858]|uniref:hypothetical protein n=1 Tax=Amycolatopsis sp. NBRC 101858 TaxID=3032200 RepID=UPI0024A54D06|nr:hypothetical protein [Amycolatopsis sp. NBRC 101858]GLY36787.1 hypothetical protein Amsp01_028110 [Amycolatopsis sp. NBRC 101858]